MVKGCGTPSPRWLKPPRRSRTARPSRLNWWSNMRPIISTLARSGEGEWKDRAASRCPQLRRDHREGPARVHDVVDEQDRPIHALPGLDAKCAREVVSLLIGVLH